MIKNNSDKRYRITAKKDEKLGLEMLSISIISISEKLIMPFILHSFMVTNFCKIYPDQRNVPLRSFEAEPKNDHSDNKKMCSLVGK